MNTDQEFLFKNIESNDVSYYDHSDGSITIEITGGTPPYMYSNGLIEQSSNVFNNLKSGSYLIAVVDNNSQTITTTTIIHEPFPLNIKLDINDVLKTNEKNGQIIVNVVGGSPPYTFNNGIVSQNHNLFNKLKSGSYMVTVADSKMNSISELAIITEPINLSIDEVILLDETKIRVIVYGGISPYTYNLTKIDQNSNNWSESNELNLQSKGLYYIKIKDQFENLTQNLICAMETCVSDDAILNIKETSLPLKSIKNENIFTYSNIQIFKCILPIGTAMIHIPKNSIKKNIPNKDTICSLNHKFMIGSSIITDDSILHHDKIKTFSTTKMLIVYHLKKLSKSKQDHIKINNLIVI